MFLFAWFISEKEVVTVKMQREYVPTPNPFNEPFHFYGYGASFIVGFILTVYQREALAFWLTPFTTALVYWMTFNVNLNMGLDWKWNRIGRSSWIDKMLWKRFGKYGERYWFWAALAVVLLLNLTYLLAN